MCNLYLKKLSEKYNHVYICMAPPLWYITSIAEIPYIRNSYVTLHCPCIFWPVFFGKAWLGHKIQDSSVWFALAQIATWSNLFCHIHKSHTQWHMWNHACTFTCFPFLSDSYNTYRTYGISAFCYIHIYNV